MRDQVCWPSPSTSWTKLFFYLVKQVIYHNLDTLIKIDKMTRLGKKHRGRSALPKGTSIKHFWAIFFWEKNDRYQPNKICYFQKSLQKFNKDRYQPITNAISKKHQIYLKLLGSVPKQDRFHRKIHFSNVYKKNTSANRICKSTKNREFT